MQWLFEADEGHLVILKELRRLCCYLKHLVLLLFREVSWRMQCSWWRSPCCLLSLYLVQSVIFNEGLYEAGSNFIFLLCLMIVYMPIVASELDGFQWWLKEAGWELRIFEQLWITTISLDLENGLEDRLFVLVVSTDEFCNYWLSWREFEIGELGQLVHLLKILKPSVDALCHELSFSQCGIMLILNQTWELIFIGHSWIKRACCTRSMCNLW